MVFQLGRPWEATRLLLAYRCTKSLLYSSIDVSTSRILQQHFNERRVISRKYKSESQKDYDANLSIAITKSEADRYAVPPTEKTLCNVIRIVSLPWFPCPFIRYVRHKHETRNKMSAFSDNTFIFITCIKDGIRVNAKYLI